MDAYSKYKNLSYSPRLFVSPPTDDGTPMEFYLSPHKNKSDVRALIEKGGGKVNNSHEGIKLLYPECIAQSYGMVSLQFILDSIEKNSLQDINSYYVQLKRAFFGEPQNKKIKISSKLPSDSKNKYCPSEDVAILNYVLQDNKFVDAGGNVIWKKAEELKITDHPWQSMKDRFRRYILNNLNSYHTVELELRLSLARHFCINVKIEKPPKPLNFLSGNTEKPGSIKQSNEVSSGVEKKSDSTIQSSKNSESRCDSKYIDYDGNPPCSSKSIK